MTGEDGTVSLVHYDVWHRALRNHSGRNRYMLKFLFGRTAEPTAPTWNNREREWQAPEGREGNLLEPLSDLLASSETERLRAAYTITPAAFRQRDEVFRLW